MSVSLGTIYAELAIRLDKFDQGLRDAEGKIKDVEKRFEGFTQLGDRLTGVGKKWTAYVTTPIIGAGAAIFKTGMDFEENMSKIVGLVGVAQDQVDAWGKDILQLAPELGKAPRELADGLFFVTSAGFRGEEALKVLEIAAKGSASGLGDTATVADALTSAINAYGIENLDASRAADILTAAVREGKLEASALAPVLGSLLPTASAMGIGFDQVAGSLAVMSRTGLNAAEASTSLNAIMSSLIKPSEGARKALDEVGLSAGDLREMAAKEPDGLIQVMRLLDEAFVDNDEALAQVIPNVRAFRGVMNVLAQDSQIVDDVTRGVTNSTGALDHAFETASKTAKFKWDAAMAQLQATLISFFETVKKAVVPVIESFTQTLAKVAEWFSNLSPKVQEMILKALALTAAIGPVIIIIGTLLKSIPPIIAAFKSVVSVITFFGRAIRLAIGFIKMKITSLAGLKAAMALMSGPLGWIALAVAAIATIGVAWYRAATESERAIKEITEKSKAQFMEMSHTIQQQVIEKIEGIIAGYERLKDESLAIFIELADEQIAITEENHEILMGQVESQKEQKLAFLEQQKEEELRLIEEGLKSGLITTEAAAVEMRLAVERKYADKAGVVEAGFGRIEEIMAEAFIDQRKLTSGELEEIKGIHEDMYAELISQMEQYVLDYKSIEALKYLDVSEMTAEQLQQYKELVAREHEAMGKDLESNVGDMLTNLEQLYAAGLVPVEEYVALKADLNQQLIDGNIEVAESHREMSAEIQAEFNNMYGEIMHGQENYGTEFVSAWEWIYRKIVGNSIVPDMVVGVLRWFGNLREGATATTEALKARLESIFNGILNSGITIFTSLVSAVVAKAVELYNNTRQRFEELWSYIKSIPSQAIGWGRDIIQGLIDGVRQKTQALVNTVRGAVDNAIQAAKNLLGISSPSKLFEGFGRNIAEGLVVGMARMDNALKQASASMVANVVPDMPRSLAVAASGYGGSFRSAAPPTTSRGDIKTVFDFRGMFDGANIKIGSESDAKVLAREIWGFAQHEARSIGVDI